jgi:4-alpha-glucanotransferase
MTGADDDLRALARAHGIETGYLDVQDVEHEADPDVLRAILRQLDVADEHPADGLRRVEVERWRTPVEPVVVAWDGRGDLTVRGRVDRPPTDVVVTLEDGAEQHLALPGQPERQADVDGGRWAEWTVALAHLPAGVHHARVGDAEATVLAAPRSVPPRPGRARQWGVFAPLHAVRDERPTPVGDLRSLGALAHWAGDRGADWVATLPLLPGAYDDDPVDPSPYRPLTRLAWNELYLDLARLPELGDDEVLPAPHDPTVVDWGLVAREVHGLLARAVDRLSDRRRAELEVFLAARPELAAYTRFRADGQEALALVHAYAQWALHDQLHGLARTLDERGQALYLDLSLGVHPDGYDAVAHADSFAGGASVGAPPDDFFAGGQDWGFAPPHPTRARVGGHPYLRACLDHHLGVAKMLRLDHVMGLHRLWWIPEGAPATSGAYVRYAAEEQWAALTLAATRHDAELIGENLGTVPPEVDAALEAHGVVGMWPLQLALPAGDPAPPAGSLAVLNTHDMAPFAAWWAEREPDRPTPAATALAELLGDLGSSAARHVQVSLEDLWLETRPQNVPGTGAEAGNWTRRAARTLPEVADDPEVDLVLDGLEAARRTAETLSERSAS